MEKKEVFKIIDNETHKHIVSENFHHSFDKKTGFAITYGKTKEEDPTHCPVGPLIADIEITTICNGIRNNEGVRAPCQFCYKSNGPAGINMSFETYKTVFSKLPKTLTQIAFGADAQAESNPDLLKIMEYTRENGVIPNITVADISDEMLDKLSKVVGAVAISHYPFRDKNICYNLVDKFVKAGIKQTNIHQLVAKETFGSILQLFEDCKEDPRLKGLNAIVLLSLKPKGRGVGYTKLDEADFKIIVNKAFELGISIGFDSCSCLKFLKSVAGDPKLKQYEMMAEPCESGLFSIYINAEGKVFPCSFTEGEILENNDWTDGIDITKVDNFIQDVWYSSLLKTWRKRLIDTAKNNTCNCRECPKYNV